jgi:hypothetical protein
MHTLLILDVSTLIGTDAQAISAIATKAGLNCAFSAGSQPQVFVFGDTDYALDALPLLKRHGKVTFHGQVRPVEWAAT